MKEPTKPVLEVGVSGCAGLVEDPRRGRVCLTRHSKEAKPLHLWLNGATDPRFELRFSGVVVEAKQTMDVDGMMISVELPQQRGRLELSTPDGDWAIEVLFVSDRFEALREDVQASWKQGDGEKALRRFESAKTELDDDEAAVLACAVGKVVLATGDYDRVLKIAEQVSGSSVVGCVGKASLLAAYIQIHLRPDFNAAELSLRSAEAVRVLDLDTRIGAAYLRGLLDHWLGNIDESLVAFEHAARLAWLVGDEKQYASALVVQAVALARLGRFNEAEELARQVEQRTDRLNPILAANIRSAVGWTTVLRREDDPSVPDPSEGLRSDIPKYLERGESRNLASQRLNLALALVQNQDLGAAAAELAVIDQEALSSDLLVWFELAAARIELLQNHFDAAEQHLDRARLLAELNQDRELEWRVAITRGELEQARGRVAFARDRYREAIRIADELALSVAGDVGRSLFVTTHSRADIALAGILLEQGDAEEAICAAIAARARHLRGLWAGLRSQLDPAAEQRYRDLLSRHHQRKQEIAGRLEHSWELSTDELRGLQERLGAEEDRADKLLGEATALLEDGAPSWSCERVLPKRAGEVVMTMIPSLDNDRWTMMAATRTLAGDLAVEAIGVHVDDFQIAGASVLTKFEKFLNGADALRVIPVGAFVEVDFHSFWQARGAELVVTYSLGLGTTEPHRLDARAVVIAGSTNLAAASRETAAVAKRLGELGWKVESRWDPTSDSQPSLLHYAGHGFDGGPLGWQSAIEIPDLGRLTAAQIVAGQRTPDWVVLGACSAGRVTAEAIDGGMNLAAAFLLAGASVVIAPVRDVDDVTAYEIGLGLYRDLGRGEAGTLPQALARLQKDQFDHSKRVDGAQSHASWRAWVP